MQACTLRGIPAKRSEKGKRRDRKGNLALNQPLNHVGSSLKIRFPALFNAFAFCACRDSLILCLTEYTYSYQSLVTDGVDALLHLECKYGLPDIRNTPDKAQF
jgi:hypothetical protein